MTERRFLVAPDAIEEGAASRASIRGQEHHHLSRVLRLGPGDDVSVFDGAGRGFHGRIHSIGRDETIVLITQRDDRRVEPAFRLTLVQGIPRHDRMDWIIQKATELGVSRIVPVMAGRSVPKAPGGGEWKRTERWRRVACEAARQSGRLRVPRVDEPTRWKDAAALEHSAPRFLFSTEDPGGAQSGPIRLEPGSAAAVAAVGPEGGWTAEEAQEGILGGFRPVGLGARVLRTETAGIVAAALLMFVAGELGPRAPVE